jgi:hypothetical protein
MSPLKALFAMTKWNAKKRKIGFELTFKEFKSFIENTGYSETSLRKGRYGLTIDRINAREPYCIGNLDIITRSANSKKQQQDYIDEYLMSKI